MICTANMGTIWELDYYSRPILDEQQKKLWEVLICESPLKTGDQPASLFRYSQFCPSSSVNSLWLAEAIQEAISQAPNPPDKIRFFRRPMANMIAKACAELDIPSSPSRRTFTLYQWLQQRTEEVYPTHPGYQPQATNPSVQYLLETPQPLPDALLGEKWAFVTLEAGAFEEMSEWDIGFGEAFSLELAGLAPQSRIPGLIIFSSRSQALAAWMSGLELAFLKFESSPQPRIILETGPNERWILANLRDANSALEGKNFEAAKQQAKQVHFIAIQSRPDSESFAGFWLLQELNL